MQRITEPELMDEAEQAAAYAETDFDESDDAFLDRLAELFPAGLGERVIDLGCGPGNVSFRLASRYPGARVTAVDGARAMLDIARERQRSQQPESTNLTFIQATLPSVDLGRERYSAIVSNSLLHHLHDPAVLWETITGIAQPGGRVYIRDLRRPDSTQAARSIVDRYAPGAAAILREDFYNSLLASFTLGEVERQLRDAGLAGVLRVAEAQDRYLDIWGRLPA